MGRTRIAIAASAALALWGCGSTPAPVASTAPFVLPSAAAALTPALYMQVASSSSLFAVRASEIAAARGDSRTRAVAQGVIADQNGIAAQLSFAGRRVDLLPSAALSEPQQADLERLRTSSDVDRDYRTMVGGVLARALDAHRTFARAGTSPTLRPVAQMAAPQTEKNLAAVRR